MVPELFTPANFDFFARYFLAGFIVFSVRGRYVLGERAKPAEIVFEAIILSLINQLVFLFLVTVAAWLKNRNPALALEFGDRVLFFAEVLLLPGILGVVFGFNLRRGWNLALFRRLSMPVVHPTRRAYDFAFSDRDESFVIIVFKDGTNVYGFFGQDSLAASDPNRSDIFLERLYDIGDDGQWSESVPSRSALVALDDIRSIEFVPIPKEQGHAANNSD